MAHVMLGDGLRVVLLTEERQELRGLGDPPSSPIRAGPNVPIVSLLELRDSAHPISGFVLVLGVLGSKKKSRLRLSRNIGMSLKLGIVES
jgi:hypothetical protein